MTRIAFVRDATTPGSYMPRADARISVEDRGFNLADGIYEVCEIRDGGLVDENRHLNRYERSLRALRIDAPMPRRALQLVLREVVRRNGVQNGILYVQVTRGAARRDHAFPDPGVVPTLVVFATSTHVATREAKADHGVTVTTLPDERWHRRDIKSISLLPNVLAKQTAREAGAYEAWLVDAAGYVTEGASTNAWIIDAQGTLITRPLSHDILPGVSREVILQAADQLNMPVEERAFTVAQACDAAEAFLSSSSAILLPVIRIDSHPIGEGLPGRLTHKLRAASRAISVVSGRQLPSI